MGKGWPNQYIVLELSKWKKKAKTLSYTMIKNKFTWTKDSMWKILEENIGFMFLE